MEVLAEYLRSLQNTTRSAEIICSLRVAEYLWSLQNTLKHKFVCCRTLQNTAERHGEAAAEHTGHAEDSAEHAFSRTRVQPNIRSAEHTFSKGRTRVQPPLVLLLPSFVAVTAGTGERSGATN